MNLRPSGYEPDELPGCSTPRHHVRVCVFAVRERCGLAPEYRSEAGCSVPAPWIAPDGVRRVANKCQNAKRAAVRQPSDL